MPPISVALSSHCASAKLIFAVCTYLSRVCGCRAVVVALAEENGIAKLVIANRDMQRANELANCMPLDEMPGSAARQGAGLFALMRFNS